jgi:hypothetical protein
MFFCMLPGAEVNKRKVMRKADTLVRMKRGEANLHSTHQSLHLNVQRISCGNPTTAMADFDDDPFSAQPTHSESYEHSQDFSGSYSQPAEDSWGQTSAQGHHQDSFSGYAAEPKSAHQPQSFYQPTLTPLECALCFGK